MISPGRFLFFFCFVGILGLSAQQGSNPFELQNRLPQSNTATDKVISTDSSPQSNIDSISKAITSNPFNVVHISKSGNQAAPAVPSKPLAERLNPFSNVQLSGNPRNFLFWVILFMMLSITVLVTLSKDFVSKIFQAFFNDNILRQLFREFASVNALVYMILYLMFMINVGILVFLISSHYKYLYHNSQFTTLFLCILASIAVFLLKHMLITVVGWVFPLRKESNLYQFTIVIFGIVLGILLVPANLTIAYIHPDSTIISIYGTTILILIVYFFRYVRSLFIAGSNVILHKFHFLVYLCAVEIAPFVILLKTILLQTGLKL